MFTNMALMSETFDDAAWTATTASVSANSTAAPDTLTTADSLIEDATASTTHGITQAITTVSGRRYCFSVYAKASTRNWLRLTETGGGAGQYYNLTTGAMGTPGSPSNAPQMQAVGNGWYRCAVAFAAPGTTSNLTIRLATGNGTESYSGDGASLIFIWGAQLQLGSAPTSYIPTTSAAVTA